MSDLRSPNAEHERHRDLVRRHHGGWMPKNCDVIERTGDGAVVGRCYFYAPDGVCPRHGRLDLFTLAGDDE